MICRRGLYGFTPCHEDGYIEDIAEMAVRKTRCFLPGIDTGGILPQWAGSEIRLRSAADPRLLRWAPAPYHMRYASVAHFATRVARRPWWVNVTSEPDH